MPTTTTGRTAGRPSLGVVHISKRERERERERESGGQPCGDVQRVHTGQRDAATKAMLHAHSDDPQDGGTTVPRRCSYRQERERERERGSGGELRMTDHSVDLIFFYVKRFQHFVNIAPRLELLPVPRSTCSLRPTRRPHDHKIAPDVGISRLAEGTFSRCRAFCRVDPRGAFFFLPHEGFPRRQAGI